MIAHPVPDAALESDIVTLAQKGAGKTYTNRGLVERLLDQGRRVVVMDPLNSWWGLKAMADGSPGYPVIVVGGPNADVQLDPGAGEALAEYICGVDVAVVVDVSEMKRGEMIRFSTAFLGALYRLNRRPLHLILEEADVFAPQQPMGDATMLLHVVDQIARRGRARGFRLWSITQRPARLNKDVLTQASTLLMLRIRSPQDRAAAEDWIKGNAEKGQAAEIVSALASLKVGEGYVWSPDFDLLERVTFPKIKTLDTSATPQHGEEAPKTIVLATSDLRALQAALAPKATQVAAGAAKGPSAPPSAEEKAAAAREYAELMGVDLETIRKEAHQAGLREGHASGFTGAMSLVKGQLDEIRSWVAKHMAGAPAGGVEPQAPAKPAGPLLRVSPGPWGVKPGKPTLEVRSHPFEDRVILGKTEFSFARPTVAKIYAVLQRAHPIDLSFTVAATRAGVSKRSSNYRAYEKELLESGAVTEVNGRLKLTHPPVGDLPDSGDPIDIYANRLPPAYAKMLRVVAASPVRMTKMQIAEAAGISPTSSALGAGLRELSVNLELLQLDSDGKYDLAAALR